MTMKFSCDIFTVNPLKRPYKKKEKRSFLCWNSVDRMSLLKISSTPLRIFTPEYH